MMHILVYGLNNYQDHTLIGMLLHWTHVSKTNYLYSSFEIIII